MNWQDLHLLTPLQGHLQLTETLIAVVDAPWTCYQGHYTFEVHRLVPLPPLERAVAGVLLHAGPQTLESLGHCLGLLIQHDPDQLLFQDPAEYSILCHALGELASAEMVEEGEEEELWQLTALGEEFAPLFSKPERLEFPCPLLMGASAQEDAALWKMRTSVTHSWSRTHLPVLTDRERLVNALAAQHPDRFRPDKGDRIGQILGNRMERQDLDRVVAVLSSAAPPALRTLPFLRQDAQYLAIDAPTPNWDDLEEHEDLPLDLPSMKDQARLVAFGAVLAERAAALPPAPDVAVLAELDAWLLRQDFLHFPQFLRLLPRFIPSDAHWVCLRLPRYLRPLLPQIQALLGDHGQTMCYLAVETEHGLPLPPELEGLVQDTADPKRKHFLLLHDPVLEGKGLPLSLLVGTDAGVVGWSGCAVETSLQQLGAVTWPLLVRGADATTQAQADAVRLEITLHHLDLLNKLVQKLSATLPSSDKPGEALDQLRACQDRAELLACLPDAAVQTAHAALRDQCTQALAQLHARWAAQWAAERQPLCVQPLQDSRAAQALRQQARQHQVRIQEAAQSWPDFCRRELAVAEAAFQPVWDAFEALPKTWVLDTNALVRVPDLLTRLPAQDRIALPHIVLDELDKLKTKRDTGKAARDVNSALDKALGQEKDLPETDRRIQLLQPRISELPDGYRTAHPDHQVLAISYQLAKEHPVVLLTEDKNLRAKAKALDIPALGLDQVPGLAPSTSSPDGPDWAALYRRAKRQKDGRLHIDDFMAEVHKAQPKLDLQKQGFLTSAAFVKSLPGFSIRNQQFIHFTAS